MRVALCCLGMAFAGCVIACGGIGSTDGTATSTAPDSKKDGPRYDVPTAGKIEITAVADRWGIPSQNRAVIKNEFFGKRWDLAPSGNITVETDQLLCLTHPHTEWLTVSVQFRNPKDLLTFDRYKKKLNAYCVDAFTFVDAVYID